MEFFVKILKGVETMHALRVVHTDLKLSNVVVTANQDPLLIDFDLSVEIDERRGGRGTLEFMDPFILENWGKSDILYNKSRDVYSLGVIL